MNIRDAVEKPILFSGPMVRAILEGRKTQTRRVIKPQPEFTAASGDSFEWHGGPALQRVGYGAPYVHSDWRSVERAMLEVCPYGQPGDRLWVRETWAPMVGGPVTKENGVIYKSTNEDTFQWSWRPSIHMPRWASRIALEIESVRVEPLQAISEADAMAEGVTRLTKDGHLVLDRGDMSSTRWADMRTTARDAVRMLWDSINAKRGFGWDVNPWVWVISFRRIVP